LSLIVSGGFRHLFCHDSNVATFSSGTESNVGKDLLSIGHDTVYAISESIDAPSLMKTGGGVVMAMAATQNAAGLITTRFFLGVPESGVGMEFLGRGSNSLYAC
jgi:hypothetical protein